MLICGLPAIADVHLQEVRRTHGATNSAVEVPPCAPLAMRVLTDKVGCPARVLQRAGTGYVLSGVLSPPRAAHGIGHLCGVIRYLPKDYRAGLVQKPTKIKARAPDVARTPRLVRVDLAGKFGGKKRLYLRLPVLNSGGELG